ncbi:amino acid adenylation domain-containing protein [Micromonospora echinospora]
MSTSNTPDVSEAGLRATLADLLEEEPATVGASTNLFEEGLDSITLMRLVGTWRRAGFQVDFAELAQRPTVTAWSELLNRKPGEPTRAAPPPADGSGEEFALAPMQYAYWVGRTDGHPLGGVAAHLYTEFDGTGVDPDRLAAALQRLVARHGMLRVRITDNGRQRVDTRSGWRGLVVHDLRDAGPDQVEEALAATRDTWSHQLLDIEAGEVFATALSLLPGGRTRLHLDVDMVAADAVSYRVVLADLARLYADPAATLPPIGYHYRDYLAARPVVRRDAQRRAAAYWRERLADLPGAPDLPLAADHPVPGTPRVVREHLFLPAEQRAALAAVARRHGVTLAATVATTFAEVLGAWSGQPRFLLNVPMFDRAPTHPDVDLLVGDFTSSVLLAVDLSERLAFADRVRAVQARLHADAANADHPGVAVLRDLTRAAGRQVIAPVVFTSALNLGELFADSVRREFGDAVWIVSQGPQVLLDAQVTEMTDGLLVNWDVRVREFADGVVPAMFAAFATLVRRLATDPAVWREPVGGLLPPAQLAIRDRVNATDGPCRARTLHEDFFAHARARPDAPALRWGEASQLTYGELADRALRVAGALTARGVAPGDPVGVSLPKGPDQVVAVLGVLAAGGAYVPVGTDQPPARAARIAALAGFPVLLTAGEEPDGGLPLARASTHPPLPAPVSVGGDDLAYLLFTSGSTGEPKGVEMPHRAATNTIDDLRDRYRLGPEDRTLAVSALDFDLSVFDIFAPLSSGGVVVVVGEDERREAQRWAELVRAHRVTVLNCVPQLLDAMLRAVGDRPHLRSLRVVLLGGDRVGVDLPARLAVAAPGCRFVALGGTTETAIHSTVCELDPGAAVPADWQSVPYGTPLRNVVVRVVDPLGRDCPDWVPGELWIGGAGVARGYRGDPGRTAERFVHFGGRRWYRTGDRARYRPDGTVEFLGRLDDQVKIRGFRVELGEVEAALSAGESVRAAVAVLTGGDRPALGAAVVTDGTTTAEEVRERVRDLLPAHMVPDRVVRLDAVPLTPNGKVDRRAVRVAVERAGAGPAARVAPDDEVTRAVGLIWAEALEVEPDTLGVTDDFFASGGDSLLATRVVAALRDTLGATVSARMLFVAPTIAGLAERMLAAEPAPARLRRAAAVYCEVAALSDDEVAAQLDEGERV